MNLTDILRSKETSIVDVRTKGEFSSSRLEGSINIPLNLIPENIEALKKMQPSTLLCSRCEKRTSYGIS